VLATVSGQQGIEQWYEARRPSAVRYLSKCQPHAVPTAKGHKIALTGWRRNRLAQPKHVWYCIVAKAHRPVVQVPSNAIVETVADRFHRLADEWQSETTTVSSVNALTSHRNYREIVQMGWDVVPYLLIDLQRNNRFWFPALYEITRIRPFDPSDAGDSKRMLEAWVKWGQRKQLI